jgi:hypothetical protein
MDELDIAIRSYVQEKNKKRWNGTSPEYVFYDRVLVFDTETTTDQFQNLTFGSFQVYENGLLRFKGLFYGETINDVQIKVLRSYSSENDIPLFTRSEFIDNVLGAFPKTRYFPTWF